MSELQILRRPTASDPLHALPSSPDRTAAPVLHRYPDWSARLREYLDSQSGRVFQYGKWDCALFVCGAIHAITGVDPGEDFRGKYLSREVGRGRLQEAGGFSAIAARYGLKPIQPSMAQRGDVLLMKRFVLGVMFFDGKSALVMGEHGLTLAPAFTAIGAWRVPF